MIEQSLGYNYENKRPTYHDLDSLVGTWSKKDATEFKKNTVFFEKIDNELWS